MSDTTGRTPPTPQDGTLSQEEAAAFLSISPRTLEKWRQTGEGPVYAKMGRRVAYRLLDLQAFVDERLGSSTLDHTLRKPDSAAEDEEEDDG